LIIVLTVLGIIAVIGSGTVLVGWILSEIDRLNDKYKDTDNNCTIDDYKFFVRR
jgi:hypothetical protein